jgi:glycosyltransferase involved in cell wall biosynthesis
MAAAAPAADARPSVLFLDKVFLKRPPDPLRGVELFNLHLLRDLRRLGFPTTLVAEEAWQEPVRAFLGEEPPGTVWVRPLGPDVFTALRAGWLLRRRSFDRLLVGNVGNGLIPLLAWLRRARVFRRAVLVAHREASPRFVRAFRALPGCVVAVNGQIARPFRERGCPWVAVDYGIFNSERFHPPARRDDAPVRFVVLGALDNAWKGADTARAAFCRLPPEVRARCELHLASFMRPPASTEPGVVAHPWLPAAGIPGLLQRMHVMLCPSRDERVMRETFSQAMVQGMLAGLPVVANDLPILAEKLDEGGGFLFRDVDELTAHMVRLAGDAALREQLGAQARAVAQARYVWDSRRFAQRYLIPEQGP